MFFGMIRKRRRQFSRGKKPLPQKFGNPPIPTLIREDGKGRRPDRAEGAFYKGLAASPMVVAVKQDGGYFSLRFGTFMRIFDENVMQKGLAFRDVPVCDGGHIGRNAEQSLQDLRAHGTVTGTTDSR